MANNQNLVPQAHVLTVEEQSKGGKASAEARRAKKTMSELARMISQNPASAKNKSKLQKIGIDSEDATNNAVVVAAVFESAISGNMQAVQKWEEYTETVDDNGEKYELPARVIGKSFVQINRHIEPNISYVFEGGRGSGKSTYVSEKIIELLKNNPELHACIVRKVAGTLRDSVYSQMLWSINELGLNHEFEATVSPLEITYKKTGQ
ncbi:MAG: phage terminase large subunit, partial [Lachnospiraceae bacterium]|nr:phage terminase large subunit [Lachnospiraceae bacterium]